MKARSAHTTLFIILALGLFALFFVNISLGAVKIPLSEVWKSLAGGTPSKETWHYIVMQYRLPKAITAVLAGMGLSISGLLMQTLFRNPLSGPYVLGLSSGASLGVAFVLLGAGLLPGAFAGLFLSQYGIVLASVLGSLLVLLAVLVVAQRLRDTMAILIVGLMFGSFTGAIVGVLTYFSSAEQLQKFTFWSLGSLGNLSWENVAVLAGACLTGILLSLLSLKPLNALLLGERYAASMGINFARTRFIIIMATSILAGSITAFAGPIAFVGLAVPHMAKLAFKTADHRTLFVATLLFGAAIMLLCDTLTQLPGTDVTLPINAITSIIGAPVVIWLLLHKQQKPNS